MYKGKRGVVFNIFGIGIKIKRKESQAFNRIYNEGRWLEFLNKYGIGPKLYFHNKKIVVYRFVKGLNFEERHNKKIIKEIFRQCRVMDKLKINKEEMHHPYKHILVSNNKVTMIDFERCGKTNKPKNVTQFAQYLTRFFKIDRKKLISLLKQYKKDYSKENYGKIVKFFI